MSNVLSNSSSRPLHLTFFSTSEEQTVALGESFGRVLRAGDVVGLDGELGAGKTRFVRGIAESLGVDPAHVSSPTYVLIHEYDPAPGRGSNRHVGVGTPVFHVDAYRLNGPEELDTLGWDRVVEAFGVTVIEWFARVAPALLTEPGLVRVRIQAIGADERRIDVLAPRAWGERDEWAGLARLAKSTFREDLPPGWGVCPVTGEAVPPDAPTFPFVSERARLADLGRWLSGGYVVSRELVQDDLDELEGNE